MRGSWEEAGLECVEQLGILWALEELTWCERDILVGLACSLFPRAPACACSALPLLGPYLHYLPLCLLPTPSTCGVSAQAVSSLGAGPQ